MTTEINWLVPDRLVEIIFVGELESEDLMVLNRLDLANKAKPVYILADEFKLRLTVPEDVFSVLGKTDGKNPNIQFFAICGAPAMMEIFSKLLGKLIGVKDKMAFFPTRAQALEKLESLLAQES